MSENALSESVVEDAALEWFNKLGYTILHGPDIAPGEPGEERATYQDVTLNKRLRDSIAALNPHIPAEAREEAFRKTLRAESPDPARKQPHFPPHVG